jgi:hypothetical protein
MFTRRSSWAQPKGFNLSLVLQTPLHRRTNFADDLLKGELACGGIGFLQGEVVAVLSACIWPLAIRGKRKAPGSVSGNRARVATLAQSVADLLPPPYPTVTATSVGTVSPESLRALTLTTMLAEVATFVKTCWRQRSTQTAFGSANQHVVTNVAAYTKTPGSFAEAGRP